MRALSATSATAPAAPARLCPLTPSLCSPKAAKHSASPLVCVHCVLAAAGCDFSLTVNAAISGHNRESLTVVTVAACQTACCNRDWCNSFDYNRAASTCDLSDAPPSTALKKDYDGNPYDFYARGRLTRLRCTPSHAHAALAHCARLFVRAMRFSACALEFIPSDVGARHMPTPTTIMTRVQIASSCAAYWQARKGRAILGLSSLSPRA